MSWLSNKVSSMLSKRGFINLKQFQANQGLFAQILGGGFSTISQRNLIEKGYKSNPLIYSAVNQITSSISRGRFQTLANEEQIDNELTQLLLQPNKITGFTEFQRQYHGFKQLTGETFVLMLGPDNGLNSGKITEMWVLPPFMIEEIKFDQSGLIPIKYNLRGELNGVRSIPAENIIHDRFWNPNSVRGLSPLEAARLVVGQSNDSYEAAARLLQNAGAIGMLTSRSAKDGVIFDEVAAGKLKKEIRNKAQGAQNYGDWLVTSAELDWVSFGMNAVDQGIISGREDSRRDIANAFGMSSILLNDVKNSTYSNVREAREELIENISIPQLWEQIGHYQRKLIPRVAQGTTLKLSTNLFTELKEDFQELGKTLDKVWWFTGNQKLERMGMPKSDNPLMDEIFMPSNLIPIDFGGDVEKQLTIAHSKTGT